MDSRRIRNRQKPLNGRHDFDSIGYDGAGRRWLQQDEESSADAAVTWGVEQGPQLAVQGGGVGGVGADLDEEGVAVGTGGVEVDFKSQRGAEVVDLAAAAEEFDEDGSFEGVAEVVPAGSFVDGDESGIDRIGLAGIDHALAFGGREEGGGPDQEGVLEVAEEGVEAVLGNGQALRFQGIIEFLDAERRRRVSEEMPLEPAQGDGIGNVMTLDDVTEDGDIDIPLQQGPAVAAFDLLRLRETSLGKILAEGFIEGGAPRFGKRGPILFGEK